MFAFYVALAVGTVVAATYLYLVYDAFRRTRKEYDEPALVLEDDPADSYDRQGRGFSWVAGGGVVVSSTLLILASVTSAAWYVLPFLGIGSAIAVVVAFLHDRDDQDAVVLETQGARR